MNLLGLWRILHELENFVLKYHAAGRHSNILAHLECILIGHRDMALAHILAKVFQARLKRFAVRLDSRLNCLRVGGQKIGR